MKHLISTLVLAAGLLATPVPHAQEVPVMFDGLASQLAMTDLVFNNTTGRIAAPATGKAAPAAARSLTYTPTAALRAQTVQGYVSRLKAKDPAASQAVAQQLGPGKNAYDQIYYGITQGLGLRDNNAADNLAAVMALSWMIVHNVTEYKDLPINALPALSAQMRPRLATKAHLTAPGAVAQLGEEMKLRFVVLHGGWQSAVKENKLPAYQQGVAALYRSQYGLDLAAVQLTALPKNSPPRPIGWN